MGRHTAALTEDTEHVVKAVVGIILDKYSLGSGVDPSFVQSIYAEMVLSDGADVQAIMAQVRLWPAWTCVVHADGR